MPSIAIPRATAISGLRDTSGAQEIAPRATIPTGGRPTTNTLDAQAIQAEVGGATELIGLGQEEQQIAQNLLQPFEKLRQSREVLEAGDIANRAILLARNTVQTLRTSQIPFESWIELAAKKNDELFGEAIKKAEGVSPAAAEHVRNQLQHERLSLLTTVSGEVANLSGKKQIGQYETSSTRLTQDYNNEADPVRRVELRDQIFQQLDVLEKSGLIDPVHAERERREFIKKGEVNDGIRIAKTVSLEAAATHIESSLSLDANEKREAINLARNAISERLQAEALAEKQTEKRLAIKQDVRVEEDINIIRDPRRKIEDLLAYEQTIPTMLDNREIDAAGAHRLRSHIDARKKEINDPVTPKDDEEIKARLTDRIVNDARTLTNKDILDVAGLTWATKTTLLPMLKQYQKEGHFSHTAAFGDYNKAIDATFPPNMAFKSLRPEAEAGIGGRQSTARQGLRQLLEKESASVGGILTDAEVRTIAGPWMKLQLEELSKLPVTLPKSTPTLENINPPPR